MSERVDALTPDPREIAWHAWLPEPALREALDQWPFVPDGREAFARYAALPGRRPVERGRD
ncbi:hypothetical protein [Streptomyces sp. NBC_01481]|uniref:hypothetical protein n=1 Tax=Streptomyces sp. NBC_01481 TaxID=2975869 RepID=UPI002254C2AE|nr:hypothetical protein [Streptomyces sp. NBC_01481]MCX4585135.1 hypothetical protein [Streptomyces sp. NBC_01481]